mmetsp:Transcript_37/g.102  ORF Transcript_37/g.102 Transcript_37/m.102 type:complete len:227 (-) Transcript_37:156-836(-)
MSQLRGLSRLLYIKFRAGPIPHPMLLDLACHGEEVVHRVNEEDIAGDLLVRNLAANPSADSFHVDGLRSARGALNDGAELLTELHIGNANHLALGNTFQLLYDLLNLSREEVLAASNHHVLLPANNAQVAVCIHRGLVPGDEEPVLCHALARAGVVLKVLADKIAFGEEFARLPDAHDLALVVDELALGVGHDAADRLAAQLEVVRDARHERDRASLRLAVRNAKI